MDVKTKTLAAAIALVCAAIAPAAPAEDHVGEAVAAVLERVAKVKAANPDAVPMAIWDFDGTIIAGDLTLGSTKAPPYYRGLMQSAILAGLSSVYAGEDGWRKYFFDDRARFRSIAQWLAVPVRTQIYAGSAVAALEDFAARRIDGELSRYYFESSLRILKALREAGVESHVLSGSPDFFVRKAAKSLGIPEECFHGVRVAVKDGKATAELVYPEPVGPGKIEYMDIIEKSRPGGIVIAGFGNDYVQDGPFLKAVATRTLPGGIKGFSMMINGRNASPEYDGLFKRVSQRTLAGGGSPLDMLMPAPARVERFDGFAESEAATSKVEVVRGDVAEAPAAVADEAYVLEIAPSGAKITAPGPRGERWARVTLDQLARLARGGAMPCCRITDAPRLKWRGFMLDTVRNYLPVQGIKDVIDVMARYKLNLFHWHLTENYAWRLESKRFPELQSDRAFLHRHRGKYYTQDEFRELVDYAWERGVTVMPEFDFPGHALAFRRAFGFGTMSDPDVADKAVALFEELCSLAPAEKMPFVHMGTDEVFKREVEGAPKETLERMAKAIAECGRTVVSWVPGEEYECAGPHVSMLWTDKVSPDTRPGPYLDAIGMYIEDFDPLEILSVATYHKAAHWHDAGDKNFGAVFCAWHDGFAGEPYENLLRNQPVFPSCVMFGDNFWHGRAKDVPKFRKRLPRAGDQLLAEAADVERRTIAQRDIVLDGLKHPFHFVRQTDMRWRMLGEDGETLADGIAQATINPGRVRDAAGKAVAASNRVVYLETWIRSPKAQTVGAWIGFTNITRDHGLVYSAPLPGAGEWNRFGAAVEVNGEKVAPPEWKRPGLKKGAEIADWTPAWTLYEADEEPFTDQEYFLREPTPVALREGWNHVKLTVPNPAFADGGKHRWSATFALLEETTDHPREIDGLAFSDSAP